MRSRLRHGFGCLCYIYYNWSSYRSIGIAQRSPYRCMCLKSHAIFLSATILRSARLEWLPPLLDTCVCGVKRQLRLKSQLRLCQRRRGVMTLMTQLRQACRLGQGLGNGKATRPCTPFGPSSV